MHMPVRKTFLGLDIVGFTRPDRTDSACLAMRQVLYDALTIGLQTAEVQPAACEMLDRGDGIMSLLDAIVEPGLIVDTVVPSLAAALRDHNAVAVCHEQIQLRAVLHTGVTVQDEKGHVGRDISHAFRLLDCPELRVALTKSNVDLVLAISDQARHLMPPGPSLTQPALTPVLVTTKESPVHAWFAEFASDLAPSR